MNSTTYSISEAQQQLLQQNDRLINLIEKQQELIDQQKTTNNFLLDMKKFQCQSLIFLNLIAKKFEYVDTKMSEISESTWRTIRRKLSLSEMDVDFDLPISENNITMFSWDNRNEVLRMDDCLEFLKKNIKDSDWFSFHKLNSNENYLSRNLGGLSFNGTTDIALFCSEKANSKYILVIFQIKKDPDFTLFDHNQSKALMIAANSSSKHPVLSVLTDLNKRWSISWLTLPNFFNLIAETHVESIDNAFEIINLFLHNSSIASKVFNDFSIPTNKITYGGFLSK